MRILPSLIALAWLSAAAGCADSQPLTSSSMSGTAASTNSKAAQAEAPPHCADGALTDDEACDDGNRKDGDGCSGNCLAEDPGYSCNPPGVPCHVVARCGDGVMASSELCDDANVQDGDGCSKHCKLELGFRCDGHPSKCSKTTCGDGKKEGAESCDDGNALPFDGCSASCQSEPDCAKGPCSSTCGDGLVLHEACDDGNDKE